MKIKAPRKSIYARIGTGSLSYSFGCSNGPTKFLGDLWTNKNGIAGDVDNFTSKLIGWVTNDGVQYRGKLDLNVTVVIQ